MKITNKSSVIGFIAGAITTLSLASLAFLLGLWYKLRVSEKMEFPPPELPSLERKIDLNWDIKTLNEEVINIGNHFKGKTIFLNFWASWCPPCVGEMPSIQNLYNQVGNEIEIVCISSEPINRLIKFKNKKGYTFPIYKIDGKVPHGLSSRGVPATYIISKEENILLEHIGSANWAHESVIKYLENLDPAM